jgi:nitrogenase molybdenum-cofactor synthesis protein NifE
VIGTREPDPVPESAQRPGITVHDVNLIGEYNIAGEFWHVAPLFDELGLRILGSLSGDARFHEVQTMHRAEVLDGGVRQGAAQRRAQAGRRLQACPFFEGSFYGITDTSQALRDFARVHRRPRPDRCAPRPDRPRGSQDPRRAGTLARAPRGKRVLLYTGGVKSWSIVSALQDLGMTVVATGTNKSTEEDKARIREIMGETPR